MYRIFRSGEITKQVAVSPQTIRRWVHRYPEFFSNGAKVGGNREIAYTPEDVEVIGTIHYLSTLGRSLEEIEAELKAGFRNDNKLLETIEKYTFSKTTKAERDADAKLMRLELQQAQHERDQALETVQRQETKIDNLMREIADLKFELGMTKGELNLLRRQLEDLTKPS